VQGDAIETVVIARHDNVVLFLNVSRFNDGTLGFLLGSQSPTCRFPESVFELPLQINRTGFQLKHAIRPVQNTADGLCAESVATVYQPDQYWPLATAREVTLYLPDGPIPLSSEALAYLKKFAPVNPPPTRPGKDADYMTAINQMNAMLADGQAKKVRTMAETVLPLFVSRPPAEGLEFFAMLGMARRATGDLAFAASCYEVAIVLGQQVTGAAVTVGVVWDNLATVQHLQKRWAAAEASSDHAIAAMTSDDPRVREHLAGVLNNRAMLLLDEGKLDEALDYSERALAIARDVFKDRPKVLEPSLEDNRIIRERLGRR